MIKFKNWCNSTLIFITFAIVSISSGPPFLKSCVTPLHSNVFACPGSNVSNHYANQNLYLQNHLGKDLQLLSYHPQ